MGLMTTVVAAHVAPRNPTRQHAISPEVRNYAQTQPTINATGVCVNRLFGLLPVEKN
jgi:hypothetical protein